MKKSYYHLLLLFFSFLPAIVSVGQSTVYYAGASKSTQLSDVTQLSDGTILVCGFSNDLTWVPGSATKTTLTWASTPSNSSATGVVAFIMQLDNTGTIPQKVVSFPANSVASVDKMRFTSVPGNAEGTLYVSGQRTVATANLSTQDGYYIAKLNGNFTNSGVPTQITWVYDVICPLNSSGATSEYKTEQPWDVGGDGKVLYTQGGGSLTSPLTEVIRLTSAGVPDVVPKWKMHDQNGTPASPGTWVRGTNPVGVNYSFILIDPGYISMRSTTSAQYKATGTDENGNPRSQNSWPDDWFFNNYQDSLGNPGNVSPAFTGGYKPDINSGRCAAICIDRNTNDMYIGYSIGSNLPPYCGGACHDFEPAVVKMNSSGAIQWWARLYQETLGLSSPDQYVDQLKLDYTNGMLVVVARCHGNTSGVNGYPGANFWNGSQLSASPGQTAYMNQLTGTNGNAHFSWLGKFITTTGVVKYSTYVAERMDYAGILGTVSPLPNMNGWEDPNTGWMNVNTTKVSDMKVGLDGSVYIAMVGKRSVTTLYGYQQMNKEDRQLPTDSAATWAAVARQYSPDLSTLKYSTILTGVWSNTTGAGGGNIALAGIAPATTPTDAILAVGNDNGSANSMPVSNVPAWGTSAFNGITGVFGRFGLPLSTLKSKDAARSFCTTVLDTFYFTLPNTTQFTAGSTYQVLVTPATNANFNSPAPITIPIGPVSVSGVNAKARVTSWPGSITGGQYKLKVICTAPTARGGDSVLVNIYPGKPVIPAAPANKPSGPTSICSNGTYSTFTIGAVANTTSYMWSLNPDTAGVISGNGTTATVTWDSLFTGTVKVRLLASNYCGTTAFFDSLTVSVTACIKIASASPTQVCPGAPLSVTFRTPSGLSTAGFQYLLSDVNGSFASPTTLTSSGFTTNSPGNYTVNLNIPTPIAGSTNYQIKVKSTTTTPNTDGVPYNVTILPLPSTPTIKPLVTGTVTATSYTTVCSNSLLPSFTYVCTNSSNAADYTWTITPSTAGTITGYPNDTSISVQWNQSYSGATATLSVYALNTCGNSTVSSQTITFTTCLTLNSLSATTVCPGTSINVNISTIANLIQTNPEYPYMVSCCSNQGYYVELSDLTGSFATPNQIYSTTGRLSAGNTAASFPINVTVPAYLAAGNYNLRVHFYNYTNAALSSDIYSGIIVLTINNPLPLATPSQPVASGSPTYCPIPASTTYTTGAVTGATGYTWVVSPSAAYTSLVPSGNSLTVNWNTSYTGGVANIAVQATGSTCTVSSFSPPLQVVFCTYTYTPPATSVGDYQTITSGVWSNTAIWAKYGSPNGIVANGWYSAAGAFVLGNNAWIRTGGPNNNDVNITIQNTHTVSVGLNTVSTVVANNLNSVNASSGNNAYAVAVGDSGAIYQTTNSGSTWTNINTSGSSVNFYANVLYNTGQRLVVVGQGGIILYNDGGAANLGGTGAWSNITPAFSTNNLRAISLNAGTGFISGDNGSVYYVNGLTTPNSALITNVSPTAANSTPAVAYSGYNFTGVAYMTNNGGPGAYIVGYNPGTGNSIVGYTTNQGASWNFFPVFAGVQLNAIVSDNTAGNGGAVVVGNNGVIYAYSQTNIGAGGTWNQITGISGFTSSANLHTVSSYNNQIIIGGDNGTLIYNNCCITTNQSYHYQVISSPTTKNIFGVFYAYSYTSLYVVGAGGVATNVPINTNYTVCGSLNGVFNIQAGGTLNITNGATFNINNGTPNPDAIISGTINVSGPNSNINLTNSGTSTMAFTSTGAMTWNVPTTTYLPLAIWQQGSTLTILGVGSANGNMYVLPTNVYANVVFNYSGGPSILDNYITGFQPGSTLTVINNPNQLVFRNNSTVPFMAFENINIQGGSMAVSTSATGNSMSLATVNGNFTISGGSFAPISSGGDAPMDFYGTFTQTGGTFEMSPSFCGTAASRIRFLGNFYANAGTFNCTYYTLPAILGGSTTTDFYLNNMGSNAKMDFYLNKTTTSAGIRFVTGNSTIVNSRTFYIQQGSINTQTFTLTTPNLAVLGSSGAVIGASSGTAGSGMIYTPNLVLSNGIFDNRNDFITLTTGTGSSGLTLINPTSNYLGGALRRTFNASLTGATSFTFPVGDATTVNYTPAVFNNPITTAVSQVISVNYTGTGISAGNPSGFTGLCTQNWYIKQISGTGTFVESGSPCIVKPLAITFTSSAFSNLSKLLQGSALAGPFSSVGGALSGTTLTNTYTLTPSTSFASGTYITCGTRSGVISGTYQVGVGNAYRNLTDIAADYNTIPLSGNTTFILNDALACETYPVTFNQNTGKKTCLIQKKATGNKLTITGNGLNKPLVILNGADSLTFDGLMNSSGDTLVFRNMYPGDSTEAFRLINDATYNTFKNCKLENMGNTTSTTLNYRSNGLVYFGNSANNGTSKGNSYNTVTNNIIRNISTPVAAISNVSLGNPSTITTSTAHGLVNNQIVTVQNVSGVSGVNGTWLVSNATANTFQLYQNSGGGNYASNTTFTLTGDSAVSPTSTIVYTNVAHNLVAGTSITISGVTGALCLNGTWTISSVPSPTSFVIPANCQIKVNTVSYGTNITVNYTSPYALSVNDKVYFYGNMCPNTINQQNSNYVTVTGTGVNTFSFPSQNATISGWQATTSGPGSVVTMLLNLNGVLPFDCSPATSQPIVFSGLVGGSQPATSGLVNGTTYYAVDFGNGVGGTRVFGIYTNAAGTTPVNASATFSTGTVGTWQFTGNGGNVPYLAWPSGSIPANQDTTRAKALIAGTPVITINNGLGSTYSAGSGTIYYTAYAGVFSDNQGPGRNGYNTISGNYFNNIAGKVIEVTPNGNGGNWTVTGNHFYSDIVEASINAWTAININGGIAATGNTVSNNYIGGSKPFTAGAKMSAINKFSNNKNDAYYNGSFYGIRMNVGSTVSSYIQGNVIKNIYHAYTTKNDGADYRFRLIEVTSGTVVIGGNSAANGNTIGGPNATDSIVNNMGEYKATSKAAIWINVNSPIQISNNNIQGIYEVQDPPITGIAYAGSSSSVVVSYNTIANLFGGWAQLNSNGFFQNTGTQPMGIVSMSSSLNQSIHDNVITGLNGGWGIRINTIPLNNAAPFYMSNATVGGGSIYRNRIYDFRSVNYTNGNGSPNFYGIEMMANTTTGWNMYNNMIYFNVPNYSYNGQSPVLCGLNIATSKNSIIPNIYHNSILLMGNNNQLSGYGLKVTGNGGLYLRNNIIFNDCQLGSQPQYAVQFDSLSGWKLGSSNYNLFVSNNGFNAGGNISGLAGWQSNTGGDYSSWYQTPANINPAELFNITTSTFSPGERIYNQSLQGSQFYYYSNYTQTMGAAISGLLTINTADSTCWYANGKGVAGPQAFSLADDYMATGVRGTTYGYGIDIGADEFTPNSGVLPIAATPSGAPATGTTQSFVFANRTLAQIQWGTGGSVPMTITCRYYSGVNPPPGTVLPSSTLSSTATYNAYWDISYSNPDTGSGYGYFTTLYYDQALLGDIIPSDEPFAWMAKQHGTHPATDVWTFNNANVYINATNRYITNLYTFGNFSRFTGVDPLNPPLLANEGISLAAMLSGQDAYLKWQVTSDIPTQSYLVERSSNGIDFDQIGSIPPNNASSITTSYHFTDFGVANVYQKAVYYRIKKVNVNGGIEYSNIAQIGISGSFSFTVYPNPFTSDLNIQYAIMNAASGNTQNITVQADDMYGKNVYAQTFSVNDLAGKLQPVGLGNLPAGTYVVKVLWNDQFVRSLVIKQ